MFKVELNVFWSLTLIIIIVLLINSIFTRSGDYVRIKPDFKILFEMNACHSVYNPLPLCLDFFSASNALPSICGPRGVSLLLFYFPCISHQTSLFNVACNFG